MKKIFMLTLLGITLIFTGCVIKNTQETLSPEFEAIGDLNTTSVLSENIIKEDIIEEDVIYEETSSDIRKSLSFDEWLKVNDLDYIYPYTNEWYKAYQDYCIYIIDIQNANACKIEIVTGTNV